MIKKNIIINILMLSILFAASVEAQKKCELFKIKDIEFYNPRVYDYPVIFKKGSHALLNTSYEPEWYAGYCAVNLPSDFSNKEDLLEYIHSSQIQKFSLKYFEDLFENNKNNSNGMQRVYAADYHLVFRGTISAKNILSGKEYLLVAGKSYIKQESDYDKNTEFYKYYVKALFAFILENGKYKLIDINDIVGDFSRDEFSKVNDILNVKKIVNYSCFENVNTLNKSNFNKLSIPDWVSKKSKK